jgi:hypothetical protein
MFGIIVVYAFVGAGVSVSVTFVILDRIFVLTHPIQYKKWRNWFIFCTFAFCFFVGALSVLILCLTELPLQSTESWFFKIIYHFKA